MSAIELAFLPSNEERILLGAKFATTRRQPHGVRGDVFQVRGRWFRLTRVVPVTLGDAALKWHAAEGLPSEDAFIALWAQCYGDKERINPNRLVYVHVFVNPTEPPAPPPEIPA